MQSTVTTQFEKGKVYTYVQKDNANIQLRIEINKEGAVNIIRHNLSAKSILSQYVGQLTSNGNISYNTDSKTKRNIPRTLSLKDDHSLNASLAPWGRIDWEYSKKDDFISNLFEDTGKLFNGIGSSLRDFVGGIQAILMAIFKPVIDMFSKFFDSCKAQISQDVLKQAVKEVNNGVTGFTSNLYNTLTSGISRMFSATSQALSESFNKITATSKQETEKLQQKAKSKTHEILDNVTSVGHQLSSASHELADEILFASGAPLYTKEEQADMTEFLKNYNNNNNRHYDLNTLTKALRQSDAGERTHNQDALLASWEEHKKANNIVNAVAPTAPNPFVSFIKSMWSNTVGPIVNTASTSVQQTVTRALTSTALFENNVRPAANALSNDNDEARNQSQNLDNINDISRHNNRRI